MTTKMRTKGKTKQKTTVPLEMVICYIATLVLAGFIAQKGLDSPSIWTFLGIALGLLFGKVSS